jgi:hypothetical protein
MDPALSAWKALATTEALHLDGYMDVMKRINVTQARWWFTQKKVPPEITCQQPS